MNGETVNAYSSFQQAAKQADQLMEELQKLYPHIEAKSKIIFRAFMDRVINAEERQLLNRMITN